MSRARSYIAAPLAPVFSFPPVVGETPRVLVLGSMPGVRSLQAGQYYAHPQNGFWPIVGAFCGFAPELPYAVRTRLLGEQGIALWDVLQSCERDGSLDAAIVASTEQPNDFATFLNRHDRVRAVLCNGGKAFAAFRRLGLPQLGTRAESIEVLQLPSTSPAHTQPRAEKARLWHLALARFLQP